MSQPGWMCWSQRGMRATLQSANLLTGQMLVALDFEPDAPPAQVTRRRMDASSCPPSESGSFSGLQASATELLRKVNTIPFDTLGRNLEQDRRGARTTSSTIRRLKQVLTSLNATLASVHGRGAESRCQSGTGDEAAAGHLGRIAEDDDRTPTSLSCRCRSGYGDNTQFNRDLERLLIQLNDATRSIRSLADLLSRHPEALIKGRPAGGVE